MLDRLRLRLRALLRLSEVERELDDELRYHLEMLTEQNIRLGMSAEDARYAALASFRGLEQSKEQCRDAWGVRLLQEVWGDTRYGARVLRKNPGFTAVAVLSLALGVGANTAIFQLLDAVLLRPLPVASPGELAEVQIVDMEGARGSFESSRPVVSNPIWEKIRDRQEAFSGAFAWASDSVDASSGGESRPVRVLWVSGDFFEALRVRPECGRLFTADDDRRGCGSFGAVISHAFWRSEYGGDPSAVGRTLTLEGRPSEIIGVAPAGFFGLEVGRSFDVALPICADEALRGANSRLDVGVSWWLTVMGRLKPGVSLDGAAAHLDAISPAVFEQTLPADYPPANVEDYLGFRLTAIPAATGVSQLRETYETPLWLLLAIAGLVLLVACANLANLLLARAGAREREISVRLALGASRARVLRQLLAESLLLALVGTAFGALLAQALSLSLVAFLSTAEDPLHVDLGADWRVLAFAAGMAVSTCVLFGLAPAFRATSVEPGAVLKEAGRGLTAGRGRAGMRRALAVSQVALSLVLVAGALLFSRSLGNLLTMDAGFRQEGILIATADMSRLELAADARPMFKEELLGRIRAVPGVTTAATANVVPVSGNAWGNAVWLDGADSGERKDVLFSRISPDYFTTMEVPVLAGRDFGRADTATSPKVAIVNEAFARQLTGGANPVGQRFWRETTPRDPETLFEIVGLVKDTKYEDLREELAPIVFLPQSQDPRPGTYSQFLIRSHGPPEQLVAAVKRAIGEADGRIGVEFRVLAAEIRNSLLREQLVATLSGSFGLLALVLACIGLYGVLAYSVVTRTNEIGIRLALGAGRRDVTMLVVREVLALVLIGVAVGVPVAAAAARVVSGLLFGLSPNDPLSLSLAAAVMLVVAAVAGYVPARRASRVDPMVALRYE